MIRWQHVFEASGERFAIRVDEPQPLRLSEQMPFYSELWDQIVAEHGLTPTPWATLVDWHFADMILNSQWDNVISSTIKIRRAGFAECYDSIDRLLELFEGLIERKIIPPL